MSQEPLAPLRRHQAGPSPTKLVYRFNAYDAHYLKDVAQERASHRVRTGAGLLKAEDRTAGQRAVTEVRDHELFGVCGEYAFYRLAMLDIPGWWEQGAGYQVDAFVRGRVVEIKTATKPGHKYIHRYSDPQTFHAHIGVLAVPVPDTSPLEAIALAGWFTRQQFLAGPDSPTGFVWDTLTRVDRRTGERTCLPAMPQERLRAMHVLLEWIHG